jgi:hypothetical protein
MFPLRAAPIALLLATGPLVAGTAGAADDWDLANESDDTIFTDNTLVHGAVQEHDLHTGAVPGTDEDWYVVQNHSMSSYEILIDSQSGGNLTSEDIKRFTGTQLESAGVPSQTEGVLSLAWLAFELSQPVLNFVQVTGAACAPNCQAHDRYRIRFYDTTYTIPRFNNSGGQSTVLFIRNVTRRECGAIVFYLDANGAMIGATGMHLEPGEGRVVGPSVQPVDSGSIRVAQGCGYGGLSGKAVSVEPSTGFTFDTEMVPRPY